MYSRYPQVVLDAPICENRVPVRQTWLDERAPLFAGASAPQTVSGTSALPSDFAPGLKGAKTPHGTCVVRRVSMAFIPFGYVFFGGPPTWWLSFWFPLKTTKRGNLQQTTHPFSHFGLPSITKLQTTEGSLVWPSRNLAPSSLLKPWQDSHSQNQASHDK